MSISFPALIIYLLPGFLGLWVFKNSVQEDLDKRGESTQTAIALLLGMSAIGLLFLSHALIPFEYISPEALSLSANEADEAKLILNGNAKFWTSYIFLCLLAMISGAVSAWLREAGFSVTNFFSDRVNKGLKRGVQRPCESAMRALIDDMSERGHEPSLVKIYNLGENRTEAVIGWWDGYSESEKEIKLSLLECCAAASELSKEFDLQTRRCLVNYDSGVVVEFLDIDETQAGSFEQYIRSEYRETVLRIKH